MKLLILSGIAICSYLFYDYRRKQKNFDKAVSTNYELDGYAMLKGVFTLDDSVDLTDHIDLTEIDPSSLIYEKEKKELVTYTYFLTKPISTSAWPLSSRYYGTVPYCPFTFCKNRTYCEWTTKYKHFFFSNRLRINGLGFIFEPKHSIQYTNSCIINDEPACFTVKRYIPINSNVDIYIYAKVITINGIRSYKIKAIGDQRYVLSYVKNTMYNVKYDWLIFFVALTMCGLGVHYTSIMQ